MCNCISEVKKKIEENLELYNKDLANVQIHSIECDNAVLLIGDSKVQIGTTFTVNHDPIKRKKSTTINILPPYCPFCGKPYKEAWTPKTFIAENLLTQRVNFLL